MSPEELAKVAAGFFVMELRDANISSRLPPPPPPTKSQCNDPLEIGGSLRIDALINRYALSMGNGWARLTKIENELVELSSCSFNLTGDEE